MSALLRAILAASVFAVLAPLAACDSGTESGSTDAGVVGDSPVGDAKSDAKVVCCPIDEPSCNGTRLGGSPDVNGVCQSAIADAPPPNFHAFTDENGCRAYRVSSEGSCLDFDAGKYGPATDGGAP